MRFLIYGENSHDARKRLLAMRKRFSQSRDTSGMNVVTLRAKQDSVERVAEEFYASPFLAEKKMVVLEGYLLRSASEQKKICTFLEGIPESTVVIFFEEYGKKTLKKSLLFGMLAKEKFTSEHGALTSAGAMEYICEHCEKYKVTVSPGAIRLLVASIGDDAWRLENEIDKLCAYALAEHNGLLDEDAVRYFVPSSQEDSVFGFLDACLEGRGDDATRILEDLLESGMTGIQVTSMLLKQFKTLAAVRNLLDCGEVSAKNVAEKLGIHPFPAGKAIGTARRFSPAVIRMFHKHLLEMDKAVKTGSGKITVLLDIFTARLSAMR